MICHNCRSECRKFGKRKDRQRYECLQCRKVITDARDNTLDGMYTPVDKAEQVLDLLVEGCSINTIERVTGVHHGTILKLLVVAGEKCEKIMGRIVVNVPVKDVQCDEIWAFVQKKEGNKAPFEAHDDSIGDAYCFVACRTFHKTRPQVRTWPSQPGHDRRIHRRTSRRDRAATIPNQHRWI